MHGAKVKTDIWVFSKICWHNVSFPETWQEWKVLHMKTNIHFWLYLSQFFLEWKIFKTKVVEKITTHFISSITFPPENRGVYEIMRKNSVDPDRLQMTVWLARIACWITKATNTHSEYVIIIGFPTATMV